MSSKRTLSAIGASLLTGVTLAAMIAPAAEAAPANSIENVAVAGDTIRLASTTGDGAIWGGSPDRLTKFASLQAALQNTPPITLLAGNAPGNFRLQTTPGNCLIQFQWNAPGLTSNLVGTSGACANTAEYQWRFGVDGSLRNVASGLAITTVGLESNTLWKYELGSGTPLTFVDAAAQPLTASGSFASDVTKQAIVSGTGEPGAAITVKDLGGKVVASGVVASNGSYSVSIPAINFGGDLYSVAVTQTVQGVVSAPAPVDFHYGVGIVVSTPSNSATVAAGAVAMTGTGTPGGLVTVFDNGGSTPVGSATVTAAGTWSLTTSALHAGAHTLQVVQLSRGNNTTTSTVSVTAAPHALTAAGSFESDVTKEAVVSGVGEPGATVTAKDSGGKVVASGTITASGSYSLRIPSINFGGDLYTVYVSQAGDGIPANQTRVDLRYGAGVAISTPAAGASIEPGALAMTGTGTPGGSITVFDNSGTTAIGTTTVTASGSWSLSTSALASGSHRLEVKQLSKGNNQTTSTVTVSAASAARDLTVSAPVNNGTIPSTKQMITVTGTGQPGAALEIRASNNRLAGTGTVAADGTYSFPALFNDTFYTATVTQTLPTGAKQSKTINFTVVATDGVNLPFSVTSPTTNGTVLSTNRMITVTGNGKAGAAVKITAANGRIAGVGTVGADGHYSFPAEFQALTYTATVTMTPKTGSAENITITNFTVVDSAGVTGPLVVTAPVSNGTAVSTNGLVTFTGTGKAGATVNIVAASNGRIAGTGTVSAQGTFSIQAEFAALKYTAYVEMKPANGAKETVTISNFTVSTSESANTPLRVSAPVSNGTAPSTNGMVTFTGTGIPGAAIAVLAASNGRVAGTGTVSAQGTFSVSAEFAALKYSAYVTMTPVNGTKQTVTITGFTVVAQ